MDEDPPPKKKSGCGKTCLIYAAVAILFPLCFIGGFFMKGDSLFRYGCKQLMSEFADASPQEKEVIIMLAEVLHEDAWYDSRDASLHKKTDAMAHLTVSKKKYYALLKARFDKQYAKLKAEIPVSREAVAGLWRLDVDIAERNLQVFALDLEDNAKYVHYITGDPVYGASGNWSLEEGVLSWIWKDGTANTTIISLSPDYMVARRDFDNGLLLYYRPDFRYSQKYRRDEAQY